MASIPSGSPTTPSSAHASLQVGASELVRLRWVAVAGQLITIAVVRFGLGIAIPLFPLSTLVAMTALSNVTLAAWVAGRRRGLRATRELQNDSRTEVLESQRGYQSQSWVLAFVLALDLVVLTSMLYYTGGVTNPFTVFYLVNLGLCAFVVESSLAWMLYGVASLGFAWLLFFHIDLPDLGISAERALHPSQYQFLGWGSFAAFLTCGSVIVHFSSRFHAELRRREQELRLADELRARSEKLEALGTLAAGAAHELATPLSTIAVVVKELERSLDQIETSAEVREDMSLIRREVDRCRLILDRMAGDAGQPSGETPRECSLRMLFDAVLDGLHDTSDVHIQLEDDGESRLLRLPIEATAQALRGLVRNGLDASPDGLSVVLSGTRETPSTIVIRVRDRGEGMAEGILQRVSEPFFTTKPPGSGMGLGVFLARTLIERLGGRLSYESAPLHGTVAIVELPVSEHLAE
ncbi:MAG: ATP-binding protein [Pirellulaceae bacterium]